MLEPQIANLLGKFMRMAARNRALVDAALAEDRRVAVAVAGATGALLAIDLLGRVAGLGPGLGLARPLLLYTSDAADDLRCVVLGGRAFIATQTF